MSLASSPMAVRQSTRWHSQEPPPDLVIRSKGSVKQHDQSNEFRWLNEHIAQQSPGRRSRPEESGRGSQPTIQKTQTSKYDQQS
ncbi:hypothetical protein U1Q18_011811 [Sarracenia purpurea var. burkii]